MAGFENDVMVAKNVNFDQAAPPPHVGIINAAGKLAIGTGNSYPTPEILAGSLTSPLGTLNIGYSSPNITLDLAGGSTAIDSIQVDSATAPGTNPVVPDGSGQITVTGAQSAAGTTANVIRTNSIAANTYQIEIQRSQAAVASTVGDNGVSHFNSAKFSVDSNGFVSTVGSAFISSVAVDANTAPGTNPVVPDSSSQITVTGAQVAAGTTTNVIRTDSLAANAYTIQIQRSQAVASSTVGDNGVSHFDSARFTVDANGFVSLKGAGFTWIDQGSSITLSVNTGYFVTAATTQTLPAAPSQGDTVKIICDTAGPVVVTANAGQTIRLSSISSSVAGTLTNTAIGDCLDLFYRAATAQWIALNAVGNWTIT